MLNPFVHLISSVLSLYLYCLIAWAIVETLVYFKIINAYQPVVQKIRFALGRLCEPALKPIRRYMPNLGGLDLSPIALILLINFLQEVLYRYFYNW